MVLIEQAENKTDCDSDSSEIRRRTLFIYIAWRLLTVLCSTNIKRNLEATDESTADEFSDEKILSKPPEKKKKKKKKKRDM